VVGITDLFSGNSFAKGLSSLSTASARPKFELQFNQLQNTIISQLNDKINQVSADDGLKNNIDVFLLNTEKNLVRFQDNLHGFNLDNNRNINAVGEMARQLNLMDTALAGNDTNAFNVALDRINATVAQTTVTNGTTVGIFIADGLQEIRRDGLLSVTNGGTTTKATKFADFPDQATAQATVDAAQAKLVNVAQVLLLKADSSEKLRVNTDTKLNATILQVQAAQIADEAEKAAEIGKVRNQYAQLLNAISLSFEVSNGMADQLAAGLFSANKVPSGSVLNIFL